MSDNTSPPSSHPFAAFNWQPQPAAATLVGELVTRALDACPAAATLALRMRNETGTRFADWIDHLVVPAKAADETRWQAFGFAPSVHDGVRSFINSKGIFPPLQIARDGIWTIALKSESAVDTAAALGGDTLEGEPGAAYRLCRIAQTDKAQLIAVERHGYQGFQVRPGSPMWLDASVRFSELFRLRPRAFDDPSEGLAFVSQLVARAVSHLGRDRASDVFFAAERAFWQRRNHAARVQKARQDRLGLGWANHDHHTYRSSRRVFARMIGVLKQLGFVCRERFYAGAEAGWGAQVLEQPVTGLVVFADVDLSPSEVAGDFSTIGLDHRDQLGTVGLWCALHGEAFLQAGMHHLEATFDFAAARQQLDGLGIPSMNPFTDFPYLRQSFTVGERWQIDAARIERLVSAGSITAAQADHFRREGALGSHLEILERNDGFKGFNQHGVSKIIAGTDPRR